MVSGFIAANPHQKGENSLGDRLPFVRDILDFKAKAKNVLFSRS
jgi:hypothetical protein